MVWEQKCCNIVMVTQLEEKGNYHIQFLEIDISLEKNDCTVQVKSY